MANEPIVLEPEKATITLMGNTFHIVEPMADGLAKYISLQKKMAREVAEASATLGRQLKEAQDKDMDAFELVQRITEMEATEGTPHIDTTEIVVFVLSLCKENPPVTAEAVNNSMTLSMKKKLLDLMDKVCGVEATEKNAMGLLLPTQALTTSLLVNRNQRSQ